VNPLPSASALSAETAALSTQAKALALAPALARAMKLAAVIAMVTAIAEPLIWVSKFGLAALAGGLLAFVATTVLNFLDTAAMLAVLVIGHHWVTCSEGRKLPAPLAGLVAAVTWAGLLVYAATFGLRFDGEQWSWREVPLQIQQHLTFALLFVTAYEYTARSRGATDALHGTQLQSLALDRELAAAQLQLLQAQVEPQFLFNTLANLRRLVRTERGAARAMLADLLRYLEVALPRLRDERSTLARELVLVRAYLAVHQVRMGTRLRTEFDVPDELGERDIPPMVLLTLVENALKHGVQPLVEGATVRVAATLQGDRLLLSVADTGAGMGSGSGSGSGLANLRARLKALYGGAASLTLQVNEPRGVVASVSLPQAPA
jgi:Histidine kinase